MTYKGKHLKKILPVAAAATLAMTATSCQYKYNSTKKEMAEQGLLNREDVKANDKYGAEVILRPIDIPTYYADGKRMDNCFVVTRGQAPELFRDYQVEDLSLQRVYLNGSSKATYIMTGKYNEIVDAGGRFTGLVVNSSGYVEIVASKNMQLYIEDFDGALTTSTPSVSKKINNHIDAQTDVIPADTAVIAHADSVSVDSVTIKTPHTFTEKQFLDTLSAAKREHE